MGRQVGLGGAGKVSAVGAEDPCCPKWAVVTLLVIS